MNHVGVMKMECLAVGSGVGDRLFEVFGGEASDERYIQLAEKLCYLLNRIPSCVTEEDVKILSGEMSALVGEAERIKGFCNA